MTKQTFAARWGKAGAEIVGIVFAVLLALWLEGWREDVEMQERADDFIARITLEVTENQSGLKDAVAENNVRIAGLRTALANGDIAIDQIGQYLVISGGSTSHAAWQSAQMTEAIGHMPIETVSVLARLYDSQAYYADYMRFIFQRYTELTTAAQRPADAREALRMFQQHLSIANSLAEQLLAQYDAFLTTQK